MTDIDGSTGEVIGQEMIHSSDPWRERLQSSYRSMAEKAVPAILEFAAEVKAFNDDCTERKQGGSTFSTMAELWLGMSHVSVVYWLQIGECSKLVNTVDKLPPSWGTIHQLTLLPTRKFTDCVKDGRINPLMTRKEATALKPPSERTRAAKERTAEDLFQDRLRSIVGVFATLSQEEMVRAIEELNTYIQSNGESNE